MKIFIEGNQIFPLHDLNELTLEQEIVLDLECVAFTPNHQILYNEFDYILEDGEIPSIKIYWGDILMRHLHLGEIPKIEYFFESVSFEIIDEHWNRTLKNAVKYFTTADNPCIPITVLS